MTQAARQCIMDLPKDLPGAANAGLVLAKYLRCVKADGGTRGQGNDDPVEARKKLLNAAIAACSETQDPGPGCPGRLSVYYSMAFDRWKKSLDACKAKDKVFKVDGRFITGLGGHTVLETGLTLHHTYGVPLIPGSSLKGLAAHYCDRVWGERESANPAENHAWFRKKYMKESAIGEGFKTLFGTTDEAGMIIFHDAWLLPDCLKAKDKVLLHDVMTPHHGDYYATKGKIPPRDFDDPNPISFLSVGQRAALLDGAGRAEEPLGGQFLVAVSCDPSVDDDTAAEQWTGLTLDLLQEALANWGAGGKTSAGYGRMTPV